MQPDCARLFTEFAPLVRRLQPTAAAEPGRSGDLKGSAYAQFRAIVDSYDPARGVPLRPYLMRHLIAAANPGALQTPGGSRDDASATVAETGARRPRLGPAATEPHCGDASVGGLARAIELLPGDQRKALIWRYYDGLSVEAIAAGLSVDIRDARSLLSHGLAAVRERIPATRAGRASDSPTEAPA
jgi:hypothetical protein